MVTTTFFAMPFTVSAAEATEAPSGATSGTTGDCTWTLDDNGVLTISGNGRMKNYMNYEVDMDCYTEWGENIKSVIIQNNVTTIGDYAFYGCKSLTSVSISDSVTSIGYDAFCGCTGLTSITIPDSVTSIEFAAFEGCTNLTSITFSDSTTYIGIGAFYNSAWYNNQPDGIVYAGKVVYGYKGEMPADTAIVIQDGVKAIANNAFEGCTGLKSITIPDSVNFIGKSVFSGCTDLTSITLPDSLTSIGEFAFYDTAWYINQPDGMIYAGKVAYEYKGDFPTETSIVIPNGIKKIANCAFRRCFLHNVNIIIPDSVTTIGDYAFEGSALESITIPDSVTSIGMGAFQNCTNLTSITIPDS